MLVHPSPNTFVHKTLLQRILLLLKKNFFSINDINNIITLKL